MGSVLWRQNSLYCSILIIPFRLIEMHMWRRTCGVLWCTVHPIVCTYVYVYVCVLELCVCTHKYSTIFTTATTYSDLYVWVAEGVS